MDMWKPKRLWKCGLRVNNCHCELPLYSRAQLGTTVTFRPSLAHDPAWQDGTLFLAFGTPAILFYLALAFRSYDPNPVPRGFRQIVHARASVGRVRPCFSASGKRTYRKTPTSLYFVGGVLCCFVLDALHSKVVSQR